MYAVLRLFGWFQLAAALTLEATAIGALTILDLPSHRMDVMSCISVIAPSSNAMHVLMILNVDAGKYSPV